jgi:hypothetical protein
VLQVRVTFSMAPVTAACLWFLGVFAQSSSVCAQTGPSRSTVCDVATEPAKYQGHLIQVQGELSAGTHSMALLSESCATVEDKRRAEICIVTTAFPSAPSVNFKSDSLPLEILAAAERELREQKTGFRGEALVQGQLFVAPPSGGFCHANRYHLMLVVKELNSYSTTRRYPAEGKMELQNLEEGRK